MSDDHDAEPADRAAAADRAASADRASADPAASADREASAAGGATGGHEAHGAHGAHARPRTAGEKWAAFKRSPFLPATVLIFILAAAAGLFAGSYTLSMANPTPHRIPTALVGAPDDARGKAFVQGMEKALNASLELHEYRTYAQAREAVDEQKAFTVIRVDGSGVRMDLASASGASVSQLLQQAAPQVAKKAGVPVTLKDIKPVQPGDPRGLALFYVSLAAVIIGFVGAIQLSVHARALNPAERIAFTLAYALLGGFSIAAVVDWLLGALTLPFVHSWLILAFTMFTSGMVFTMFNTLIGRWAMVPTWGLMVLLGNPSSGGAVSWPLLPSVLGHIGQWLPPGASVNAQHTAVYFPGHQHVFPYLVLAGWSLLSCTVFWLWRHRHPGGRPTAPAHAAT
ncbi:ABC transporter permease [Streptomyces sp. NPDC053560]|uniref:ABC transporter permease n=1 Tax=Streptomyces sp. NPDC053560 TaxID=3365711 RepID=UPI0037CEB78A